MTFRFGTGVPDALTTANVGDYYINTDDSVVYGPRDSTGLWPIFGNLSEYVTLKNRPDPQPAKDVSFTAYINSFFNTLSDAVGGSTNAILLIILLIILFVFLCYILYTRRYN